MTRKKKGGPASIRWNQKEKGGIVAVTKRSVLIICDGTRKRRRRGTVLPARKSTRKRKGEGVSLPCVAKRRKGQQSIAVGRPKKKFFTPLYTRGKNWATEISGAGQQQQQIESQKRILIAVKRHGERRKEGSPGKRRIGV